MSYKVFFSFVISITLITGVAAQPTRWQQAIRYSMDVNLDVQTNIIKGKQSITYINNSPDTLRKIFVHMFYNAFQPNSMMDVSSRSTEKLVVGKSRSGNDVVDFDLRFKKRIVEMKPEEQGSCTVSKFIVNGRPQQTKLHETILEVILDKPIMPKSKTLINTEFESVIPLMSRRSGRDNPEGIRYSLGQWYPRIVEYDYEGWHADDYISREFYGVWGDYDVNITLDKNYKLGATGVLVNANAIGWGYDKEGTALKDIPGNLRTWKFSAKNVHDFVWAADPDYKHFSRKVNSGLTMHWIYKNDPDAKWQASADSIVMVYPFLAKTYGLYPYPVYSFLQGGGGGTEYPMATLVKNSSFGTELHELSHSWYQMLLGTNEVLYAWMDEGFATYAGSRALSWLRNTNPFISNVDDYNSYFNLVKGGFDEPMSTNANQFYTNRAYNTNSYSKGCVFIKQLGYVIGEQNMDKLLLEYYRLWHFKHPNPNDFMRVAQDVSGMQLQWYKEYMLYTTKTIDYAIDSLWEENGISNIRLKRIGQLPMPVDLQLTYKDGSTEIHYIPLNLTFGNKPDEKLAPKREVHEEWKFTHPTYIVQFKRRLTDLKLAEIDPTQRLADINRKNNVLELNW